ncbi:MAG: membrane dipeptidase [candidate division Zixibacteria bacterium]
MSYSRRKFLRDGLVASAGLVGASLVPSMLGCMPRYGHTSSVDSSRRVLADLHVHAMINEWNRSTPLGVKYPAIAAIADKFVNVSGMNWKDCHAAGIDLMCVAHFNVFDEWLSMPTDPNPEAPRNSLRMMDQLEEELSGPARNFGKLARTKEELRNLLDVRRSSSEFRTAVVHTLEGGHALGGNLEVLPQFASRGVATIDITHFFSKHIATSANSFPYFPDDNSSWPYLGLTEFGVEVIAEMERLGIIVDVTHATSKSIEDILKVATRPLMVSHGSARTLSDHPYGLLDEHIKQIASGGGLIGVIIDPYLLSNYASEGQAKEKGTLSDVVRMIRYLVKLCGDHKHVAIGSDFAGFIAPPKEMNRLSQIGRLTDLLDKEFGNPAVVEDIMANNSINFLLKNWQKGA